MIKKLVLLALLALGLATTVSADIPFPADCYPGCQ
jgi:hypothetical protein